MGVDCCSEQTKDPLNDNIQTNLIRQEFSLQAASRPSLMLSATPVQPPKRKAGLKASGLKASGLTAKKKEKVEHAK